MAKRIKAARGAFERAQVRGPSLNVLLSNPRSAVRAYAAAAARLARLLEQHTEAAAVAAAKPAAEESAESAERGADDEALEEALAAHLEGARAQPRRAAKRLSCPPRPDCVPPCSIGACERASAGGAARPALDELARVATPTAARA